MMTQPHNRKTKTKPKPKVSAKKQQRANTKNTKTQKKRGRSESTDSDEDGSDSKYDGSTDQEVPVTKKKPVAKKARTKRNLDAEIEVVENDVRPCEEDVEAVSAEEVSYVGLIILNI